MTYYFFDTSSLLNLTLEDIDNINNTDGKIIISDVSLREIEDIKTSAKKDEHIKYLARQITKWLNENVNKYEVYIYKEGMLDCFYEFAPSNDIRILACAYSYDCHEHPDETVFVTNDLALKNIANLYFGSDSIISIAAKPPEEQYKGYTEKILNDEDLSYFYEHQNENVFNLLENEYLIIYSESDSDKPIDLFSWREGAYKKVYPIKLESNHFGKIEPLKGDVYQILAIDSLVHNQVSMICGKPGSGKTMLSFAYLFSELEKGKLDQIIVFCNPVVAKNAAKLGYYKGTALEKLLQTQAGMVLSSKLGSAYEVENLIEKGKLVLIPAGDARGYEVPANSGVYIMESQNLTIELLRMLLQRISENCKVIVDGDYFEQVDMDAYSGRHNGMNKMSEIFRGESIYGQVQLQKINRSKIAAIADKMR